MKTLKDVRDKFESTTVDGHEVIFLAYHPETVYPIIAEIYEVNVWKLARYTNEGVYFATERKQPLNLVKKKERLPKDILCEVSPLGRATKEFRYSDGSGEFFYKGQDSHTTQGDTSLWDSYKIVENSPQPWTGGTCPIPEGCRYRVFVFGEWSEPTTTNKTALNWEYLKESLTNITAYQILGES